MPYQTPDLFGTPDGLTNSHIRKQIHRLRLSKGWTKHELEEAAQMAPDTLEDFEAGIRCLNVDTLRKLIEALESDITEVWPSATGAGNARSAPLPGRADEAINLSRLAEIHSLTGAEASCMILGKNQPDHARNSAEEPPAPVLQVLSSINLDHYGNELLCRKLQKWILTSPWTAYHCNEDGRSLFVCLKNARLEFWAEGFIQRCLSNWLASAPL
ncbi:MAG TPA: helix-turn-helix transcriptional regulator [Terriglobia bacterium]|nr:helix-turn-helix transcriptional regulator [Terriglobia bacterium]